MEKKKSKAAERNELEPFKDLNWESSKNSGSELHDASLWTTVDQFTKDQNTLQEDIDMLQEVWAEMQKKKKEGEWAESDDRWACGSFIFEEVCLINRLKSQQSSMYSDVFSPLFH